MLLLALAAGALSGSFLITLLILCIILGVAYWLITNFLPEPIRKYGIAAMIVIAAIYLIQFLGGGSF